MKINKELKENTANNKNYNKLNYSNKSECDIVSNSPQEQPIESDLFVQSSEIHSNNMRLSTGANSLDEMIRGGLETKTITQFFGPPSSGKTQICFTLCTTLPSDFKCIFIDTEGTFRTERIQEIARTRKTNIYLQNILVSRVSTTSELENVMNKIEEKIQTDLSIKLIIIDSMTNLYRVEYQGPANLSQRQQKLTKVMHKLLYLARFKNIAVVVTNQVYSEYSAFNQKDKPVGGYCINYPCTNIIRLEKRRNGITAELIKSPYYANDITYLLTTEEGITDDKENLENRKN